MSITAIRNRVTVAQLSYDHALERHTAAPTPEHLAGVIAAAITLFLAQTTTVTD